jgi:hypothetical protein
LRGAALIASSLALLGLPSGCGGGGSPGGGGADAGLIKFHGEQMPFAGFDQDTGYQPDGSPVQVRFEVGASGGITVDAQAVAGGSLAAPTLSGKAGSGKAVLDGGFTLKVSLKVDVGPLHYDGPLMGTPDIEIKFSDMKGFDPFSIGQKVSLAADIPDTEVAAIPLQAAAGIPGTLHIHASGTVTSDFSGTCAAVSSSGAQYLGQTSTGGMLVLSATVEIDVPLAGTKTFGPFDLPAIPVGPFDAGLDLGTQPITSVGVAVGGDMAMQGSCSGTSLDGGGGDAPQGQDGAVNPDGTVSGDGISGGDATDGPAGDRPPADPGLIGQACSACPGNPCFGKSGDPGICSYDCTADATVCGTANGCVAGANNMKYCLPGCTPALGSNQCDGAGTACDYTGVCIPACTADSDCNAAGAPATGYCNLDLGDCLTAGSPTAQIGDSCSDSTQCPRNGVCIQQGAAAFCATVACDLGGAFSCPSGAACVPAAQGSTMNAIISLCLKICTSATDCGAGQSCLDPGIGQKVCIPGIPCASDSDCTSMVVGTTCVNGLCQA